MNSRFKKKWIASLLLFALILSMLLQACGKDNGKKSGITLYNLNAEHTEFITEKYQPKETEPLPQAEELVKKLSDGSVEGERVRPLPRDITLQDMSLDQDTGLLTISFSRAYSDLDGSDETMIRAAVVKTLLQVKGIDLIDFQVDHTELTDASGNVVGAMDAASFVDGMTSKTSPKQKKTFVLYYPNGDGSALIKEERTISYSSNTPAYRTILETLQTKPSSKKARAAFPSSTQILSLSMAGGICYINFDSSFSSQSSNLPMRTSVYAIVNSLTELSSIKGVQISVDGENLKLDEEDMKTVFTRNTALLPEEGDSTK